MSLINLEVVRSIIHDLNAELNYKLTENAPEGLQAIQQNMLLMASDGENHSIQFLGDILWSSVLQQEYENIPPEKEMTLNEREHFEPYLRKCINDKLDMFQNVRM